MSEEGIEELKAKTICSSCIGEEYLSKEVSTHGDRNKCNYCGKCGRTCSVGELADRMQSAFEQHYIRTADEPDGFEFMLMKDRESNYEWERDGEPVVYAIMNAAHIPESAAEDVQIILSNEYEDIDSAAIGIETEFSDESCYKEKDIGAGDWHQQWYIFERSLKTETRFFSRKAADYLAMTFDGINELRTGNNHPLIIDAGPGTEFSEVYRARAFQSDEKLRAALCRPDTKLGSPPSMLASAGRMNGQGISVFYGANDPSVAIAEVRAPVGSQVAVARFEIVRHLRLLDMRALSDVTVGGSVFDIEWAGQLERTSFLRSLSHRITRPVMPNDEPFEYLATQAIADFLATDDSIAIDGIIYSSVQAVSDAVNVILFHKAARVEAMDIPEGAEINAITVQLGEEGMEDYYAVVEKVPKASAESNEKDGDLSFGSLFPSDLAATENLIIGNPDNDRREFSLRVAPESVRVHRVLRVDFETKEFPVYRHRRE